MERKAKHVIFLGAGASATSGYPVADQLRKEWLASEQVLLAKATDQINFPNTVERDLRVQEATRAFRQWYEDHRGPMKLFRQGGFGTIDEFCYHARHTRPDDVRRLKAVLRFALGVHSPEAHFHKSDYYSFVQKLFLTEKLSSLRDDVAVLSFNYDPYLEWLLERAIRVRLAEIDGDRGGHISTIGTVTSGFFGGKTGLHGLKERDGFSVLKLRGSIAWPAEHDAGVANLYPSIGFNDIFHDRPDIRAIRLSAERGHSPTPIIFPWELFEENDEVIPETKFSVKEDSQMRLHGQLTGC